MLTLASPPFERVLPPFSRMVQPYPVTTYLVYFTIFVYVCNGIFINNKEFLRTKVLRMTTRAHARVIYTSSFEGVSTLLNSFILLFAW